MAFMDELSAKDKLIFIGGGILVAIFVIKILLGGGSTPAANTSNNTDTPNELDSILTQTNKIIADEQSFRQSLTQQLTDLTTGMQKNQTDATTALGQMFAQLEQTQEAANKALGESITSQGQTFSQALQSVSQGQASSMAGLNSALGTISQTQSSIVSLLQQMAVSTPAPPSSNDPPDSNPGGGTAPDPNPPYTTQGEGPTIVVIPAGSRWVGNGWQLPQWNPSDPNSPVSFIDFDPIHETYHIYPG